MGASLLETRQRNKGAIVAVRQLTHQGSESVACAAAEHDGKAHGVDANAACAGCVDEVHSINPIHHLFDGGALEVVAEHVDADLLVLGVEGR